MSKRLLLFIVVLSVTALIIVAGLMLGKKPAEQTKISETSEPTKPPEATLEIISQPVWVRASDSSEKAEAVHGQGITAGTTILTGANGRAQILYPNKSVTRLDEDTEIVLTEFTVSPQKVGVKIEKNRVWSRVAKLLGRESYQTETNTVVATVRGTSYGHGILPNGKNKILSTKGAIGTDCLNDAQEAVVTNDTKVELSCKEGEEAVPGPLVIADKDEWVMFNESEDKKLDERFGEDIYGDSAVVLGATTGSDLDRPTQISGTPTATPTPTGALIDCLGADSKVSRVTKAVCDSVNAYWVSKRPTPTPTPGSSSSALTSPTPTPTLTLTPTPGFIISSVIVYVPSFTTDLKLLSFSVPLLNLVISGSGFVGGETVEFFDTNSSSATKPQSAPAELSAGQLFVSFASPPCGATYGVKVNGTLWSGAIGDSDRPECFVASPTPPPPPITIVDLGLVCVDLSICSDVQVRIYGSGFDAVIGAEAIDATGASVAGSYTVVSSTVLDTSFINIIPGSYSIRLTHSDGTKTISTIPFTVL